jgi:hypothetical protein
MTIELPLAIDELGTRVASVWYELRPTTRSLVVRALQPSGTTSAAARNVPYDGRADLELSQLLTVLDERAEDAAPSLDADKAQRLRRIADTCANVLQEKTQSAEVFAQLVGRAQRCLDYRRIDRLADALTARFAPGEMCELARSEDQIVRALADEALAQLPTTTLLSLLSDPVDSMIAREALRRQAADYGSEHAQQVVEALDRVENGE